MICVKEWKRKTLHTLNLWDLRIICAVRSKLNFCIIIPIILIGNSLCSLEYDLLYIVEIVYVIFDNIS